jgi:hypothetical protein
MSATVPLTRPGITWVTASAISTIVIQTRLFIPREQDIASIVQEGSFGLIIQRDGEDDKTYYAFHVCRAAHLSTPSAGCSDKPGMLNGMSSASGATGSTISLSEIAVKCSESPKQELLRHIAENIIRSTCRDPVSGFLW